MPEQSNWLAKSAAREILPTEHATAVVYPPRYAGASSISSNARTWGGDHSHGGEKQIELKVFIDWLPPANNAIVSCVSVETPSQEGMLSASEFRASRPPYLIDICRR
jgi:hypothetical protein